MKIGRKLPVLLGVAGLAATGIAAPAAADPPPSPQWIAMGDSYQAGVGAGDYYPDSGACQRSPHAVPPMIDTDGVVPATLNFVACSGATTQSLYESMNGETPQMTVLNNTADVTHVTVGIGGNDLQFAGVLRDCILQNVSLGASCRFFFNGRVQNAYNDLTNDPNTGENRLWRVYTDGHGNAPNRKVVVATYPKFFPPDGGTDWTRWIKFPWIRRCNTIRVSDQLWMNDWIRTLDDEIIFQAQLTGSTPVDFYNASDGHELCSQGDPKFLNGLRRPPNLGDSFHPTQYGYGVEKPLVEQALLDPALAPKHAAPKPALQRDVTLAASDTRHIPVKVTRGVAAGFTAESRSGGLTMRVVDPHGRVITAATKAADVHHRASLGSGYQNLYVTKPTPGTWTIELTGAKATKADVTSAVMPTPNTAPHAAFTMKRTGNTVRFHASGDDPDGKIRTYMWEFDDGTLALGKRTHHTYRKNGNYLVTLTAIDSDGKPTVVNAPRRIIVH